MVLVRRPNQLLLLLWLSGLVGCGSASTSTPRRVESGSQPVVEPEPEPEPPRPQGTRALDAQGTFESLVTAVRVLEDRDEGDSESPCALQRPTREGWPWQLRLDTAAAVRPVPQTPEDLDTRLDGSPSPVLVLTRWNQLGSRSYEVALALLSNTPARPDEAGLVLSLTNRGVYWRWTDRLVSAGRTSPLSMSELERRFEDEFELGQLVVVTAEAGVALTELVELIEGIPEGSRVALAVALDAAIRIPEPPEPALDRGAGLCPDGLPPMPVDEPHGQLEPALIVGSLYPFQVAVRRCLTEATMMRSPGGRVEIAMRINADGLVGQACAVSDEVGGTLMRDCLLRAARSTHFPHPDPAGYVDVELPIMLQPTVQEPLCE